MLKFKRPDQSASPKLPNVAPPRQAQSSLPAHDFYDFDGLLTPEDRAIRDKVRHFANNEIIPIIAEYWERDETPMQLLPKLASLNLAGGSIKGYGCPGMSVLANGLIGMEMTRGDGSISTLFGVHSGLAMYSIAFCGSEDQKQKWLPPMARLEKFGAFALTEPFIGSDAAHIQTTARRDGDYYVLNGAKRWIGGATMADVIDRKSTRLNSSHSS